MPTRLAAAALTAGVVVAGSAIGTTERVQPIIEAKVVNTSLITDFFGSVGWFVQGAASSVAIPIDTVVSLPFDALTAIAVAVQNPGSVPSVLSWLVNRYANPAESYPYYTFPWDFKTNALGDIALAFPYPLGPSGAQPGLINSVVDGIANAIGSALSGLPDPAAGAAGADAFWATTAGRILTSVNNLPMAPVWALWDVADYAGFLPYNVVATIESAIKSPQAIPGLISNLIYGLLGSDAQGGLAGYLIHDLSYPLTTLPGPVGQFATNVVANLQQGLDNLLANLPAPVPPNLLAAKTAAGAAPVSTAAVAGAGVGAADIPAVAGPSVNAVTLAVSGAPDATKAPDATNVPDAAKAPDVTKAPDTTKALDNSKSPDAPDASKAPDAPTVPQNKPGEQDGATATGPAAGDTGTAGNTDKPKTTADKVKSGNKVRPGTKTAPSGAATGNTDTPTSTTGSDKPPVSGGTDKPAGGAHPDPSGSSSVTDHAGAAA
ncbi:hypothetical protein [Mycolicibacterium aubagnense]|nr:hypothetical protein [Mycolicibacterium aubagnense]TLH50903.1 hypothetical protein C1S80_24485 [Mycolicibacterium aubagnense]